MQSLRSVAGVVPWMAYNERYWFRVEITAVLIRCLLVMVLLVPSAWAGADLSRSAPWVLIDTQARRLTVMGVHGPLAVFPHIAIGSAGAGRKRHSGDNITPLGRFRVGWINPHSRFDIFIGLDYPDVQYARLGLHDGRIDQQSYRRIRAALAASRRPPQDTSLGGYIGIHGVGAGSAWVQANFDWTDGCIALSNRQIRRLTHWVKPGTRVVIR